MSGERVDVLAVIRAEVKYLTECAIVRGLAPFEQKRLDNLTASLAAVAELIAADRAFDLSRANLTEVSNRIVSGSRSDNDFREQTNAQHAYDRAAERRAAALSRIQPDGQRK